MSLKSSRIIAIIGAFVLSFICHFAYQLFPNFLFSIIFPVNESVWEHMKILYTSILLYGIIDYFLLKKKGIHFNNFFLNLFVLSFSSVIIYLMVFLPIYYRIGENMFMAISIMIIAYVFVYIMSYYILSMREKGFNFVWISFLVLGYILFGYLTYNPIKNNLFFDTKDEIYGIKNENS